MELLDKKAKPVVQKKIRVINGLSTGVIEVPEDILTGVYYIRAYTQYMRNFEKELFYTTELTIINADLPAKEIIQTIAKDTVVDEKSGLVQINMPSAVFIPNASVEVELTGKESKEVSVSVVKKGSYESNKVGIHKFYKISAADAEKKLKWYPEIRSVSITGKVVDKQSGEPVKNMLVFASVIDSVKQFHVAKTNDEGTFAFALMHLHDNHQVYIGSDRDATILINPDFAAGLPTAAYATLKMDSTKLDLLNKMYTNSQVMDIYKDETVTSKTYLDTLPDPFQTSMETILFKDYVALPTMTDMFNEIIPYTKVKTRKEGVYIQLADKKDKTFFENTLILLDNIPFHDHAALLNIPPAKINSVGVIAGRYVYGGEILNGVISIKSKDGNLAGLPLPGDIVVVDYITYNPDVKAVYEKTNGFSANKPGFKNTLYWNPYVELKDGKQIIQFAVGNEASDYDIVVRGVDANGNLFTTIKTITVLKPSAN